MADNTQTFEGVELTAPNLRPCMYLEAKDSEEARALLHLIYPKSWTHGAGLTIGSAPAGQETHASVVLELEDGSIVEAGLWQIRMLDSLVEFNNVTTFSTKEDAELWFSEKF